MAETKGPIAKANIIVVDSGTYGNITFKANEKIEVQFNPQDYSISARVNYNPKKSGLKKKNKINHYGFVPAEPKELQVKLFYDTAMRAYLDAMKDSFKNSSDKYEEKYKGNEDVNAVYIDKLMALVKDENTNNKPPEVIFSWGSTNFKGYVTNLQVNYMRFNVNGEPTRAEVSMSMMETINKDVNSGSSSNSGSGGLIGDEPMGLDSLFGD